MVTESIEPREVRVLHEATDGMNRATSSTGNPRIPGQNSKRRQNDTRMAWPTGSFPIRI